MRDLLVAADNAGVKIAVEQDGIFYGDFSNPERWGWAWPQFHKNVDIKTLENMEVSQLFTIANSIEESKIAAQMLSQYLPDDLRLLIKEEASLFVILHKEAIKSKGIDALAEYWKIKPSEIVGFGDDTIDIDMLEYCGVAVAVSNALAEVKALAEYVCDTNDNDGVAKWLEENVL